jgi:hypothetical protein
MPLPRHPEPFHPLPMKPHEFKDNPSCHAGYNLAKQFEKESSNAKAK